MATSFPQSCDHNSNLYIFTTVALWWGSCGHYLQPPSQLLTSKSMVEATKVLVNVLSPHPFNSKGRPPVGNASWWGGLVVKNCSLEQQLVIFFSLPEKKSGEAIYSLLLITELLDNFKTFSVSKLSSHFCIRLKLNRPNYVLIHPPR